MPTWRERIVAARERGAFTGEDLKEVGSWTTCAVGEAHLAHPEVVSYSDCAGVNHIPDAVLGCGCPTDKKLERLGDHLSGFMWAVRLGRMDTAEALLDQIEDRVLELKRAHV